MLNPNDIEKANELLYKENVSSKDKQKLTFHFKRAKNVIEQYELIKQHEIVAMMRHFVQKKAEEHTTPNLVAKPVVKLPIAESFGLTEAKEERLSQIIAESNSRTGKACDNDVAVKVMLQIRDILLKSDKLKTSVRNNTVKDFKFSCFNDIDDALLEGLEQNQDFFSLLLSNDEIKR